MSIRNYGLIASAGELREFIDRLLKHDGPIGFDLETGYIGADREKASIHPETAMLVGISFTDSTDWARYVPLNHDVGENLDNYECARLFWELLNTGRGVAHNAVFELRHLSKWFREQLSDDPLYGEAVRKTNGYFPVRSDTQVEAYLVAEYQKFGLKYLTFEMFGHQMTELYDLFDNLPINKRKFLRFNTLELTPQVIEYACEDSVWCLAIHQKYYDQVKDQLLYKVEHAIVESCVPEMEDFGVRYDWAFMRRSAEQLRAFRDKFNAEIMTELSDLIGETTAVNLASPPQISDVLFNKLGYRTTVYTDKTRDLPFSERKMSTGSIALEALSKQHPVVKKILQWKEMTRLLGTYLDKYEATYGYADDGRTHPHHMSAIVITGRFAVADPPYQQCVPGSYQVLTPDGWVRFDQLQDGVPVAQYADNQSITFVVPEVARTPYKGDMVEVSGVENGRWRYTPSHRMVYRLRSARDRAQTGRALTAVKETTAEQWAFDLARRPQNERGSRFSDRYLPCAGYATEPGSLSDAQRRAMRLAVACQADGSRTNGHQYDISVTEAWMVNALRELGLTPIQQADGCWRARVHVDDVWPWLDDTNNFRASTVLHLHQHDLSDFLAEVMRWNGDSTREATYRQKSARRQSVDVVQAAAALCGHATSLYERPEYDAVLVNVSPRASRDSGTQLHRRVPVDEVVYCVTVPTGMFLCRNDEGDVQVTGNSPKKYHFDLADARAAHEAHADAHGPKCACADPEFTPSPSTCFKFNFRDAIIAPVDHYILGFDLSQAELRAIAGEAQETALLRAFEEGEDVHTLTAALMLGISAEDVTKEQRDIGKTFNFALLYGMGVKSLADRLALPVEEAQLLYDKYFAAYPNIAIWSERQVQFGKQNGYVTSKFGRKLPIWEYLSDKRWVYQKGDRACVNYPIQGAATGDYMKIAMVRARAAIHEAGLADKMHMVMNIHDALEFYVHKDVPPQTAIGILKKAVVFGVSGWPAMAADWHIGKKWGTPMDVEVKDDGGLIVKGEKVFELEPSHEIDEDTGEQVVVLPEVDTSLLSAAANESLTKQTMTRRVIMRLNDLPAADAWASFVDLVKSAPGDNTLHVRFGEEQVDVSTGTAVDPSYLARVSVILGPVSMVYDADDVDASALVEGLVL